MAGFTSHEEKQLRVDRLVVDLVAAVTDLEQTAYFKVIITAGTGSAYGYEVQKKSAVRKPPPLKRAD